jgi:hypothetical protein
MHDPLGPARGFVIGILLGLAMWAAIVGTCWLIWVSV